MTLRPREDGREGSGVDPKGKRVPMIGTGRDIVLG